MIQDNRKKIAILTSGGDAPGMNAAIRSITRTAIFNDIKVVGVKNGYKGLHDGNFINLNMRDVSNILHQGGTMLYSSRCPEFLDPQYVKETANLLKSEKFDAVFALGGDGTFKGAYSLIDNGINCFGIPCTIDNDVASTDYTIGFDTAVNTAVTMIDKVRDTSRSHSRCSVIEVMGRDAGYIAIETAIACGALAALIPEIKTNINDITEKMMNSLNNGKRSFTIIVAEGAGKAHEIAKKIEDLTKIETNPVVLGYVQRGGTPTSMDRTIASEYSYYAVNLFLQGKINKVIGRNKGKITDIDFKEAINMKKSIDIEKINCINTISI